ncbi:putative sulfite reductase-associated electron transfer protein DsrJ [Thermanaeromonas toyohensis ToBE]|uniref:Putative sulfite reductase-associated electron transfer protein DsrJ n=2 Tax=Thermanaeromonas TaxID=202949 RepID=A0A1W1VZG4_9FIRM|nr:putative sulfite reductase-associated electron transfer protein DsrJ [Thermanaeromonas toyohensis ToBE]
MKGGTPKGEPGWKEGEKMRAPDFKYILVGVGVFIVLFTFPFWYNAGRAATTPTPNLDTPAIKQMGVKECVEPTSYMRANHMRLLNEWRDRVVRQGERVYVSTSGKEYTMSLQNTCLACHSNKAQFCDECHNYLEVKPDCWSCHLESKGK